MLTLTQATLHSCARAHAGREATFEEEWKVARLRELATEDDKVDTLRAAHESRFTATEADEDYTPSDPYAAGIQALQQRKAR